LLLGAFCDLFAIFLRSFYDLFAFRSFLRSFCDLSTIFLLLGAFSFAENMPICRSKSLGALARGVYLSKTSKRLETILGAFYDLFASRSFLRSFCDLSTIFLLLGAFCDLSTIFLIFLLPRPSYVNENMPICRSKSLGALARGFTYLRLQSA